MIEEQPVHPVTPETLTKRVREFSAEGYRLIHICATTLKDSIELTYAFDKEGKYVSIRLTWAPGNPPLPSITSVYWAAFIYENEIHDLFGVKIDGNVLDFKGGFYRLATPHPFACGAPVTAPATPQPSN